MKPHKIWLTLIGVVLVISVGAAIWVHQQEANSRIADVYLHGKVVKSVDLAKVKKPYTFRIIDGHGGWNDIHVEPGKIEIAEANCPDQLCVHQGSISNGIEPIVCLPHELVIRIRGEKDPVATSAHSHTSKHAQHHHSDEDEDVDIVVK